MNFRDSTELDALAGEYVLGTLAPEDLVEFERELRTNAELARAVYAWEDRLLGLAKIPDSVAPAQDLWSRIERDLPVPQPALARSQERASERTSLWSSVVFWRSAAAFAAAAAVVLAWITFLGPPTDTRLQYAAVLQAPDKSAGWLVEADALKQVRLTPLVRTAVQSNQALELWTQPEGAAAPMSLGLVPTDRVTVVSAERLPGIGEGQLFAISLEPRQGSPTGQPTGPILFAGRTAAVP
jgi:anti-sigma-K factor RskA